MTNIKKTSTEKVISSNAIQGSVVSTEPQSDSQQTTRSSSQQSSQMQLLSLAKQFAIEGAMLPEHKQMPLDDRSEKRQRHIQLRQQQNLESIIQKALAYCASDEVAERADQDWFYSFTELAENISNRTMQELWAKILAGEISSPGSFSLKSLQAFRTMSIHDAKLFAKACSVAVKDGAKKGLKIISGASQSPGLLNFFTGMKQAHFPLNQFGLNYTELLTLADNHLIFIQETETMPLSKGEDLHYLYNGHGFTLSPLSSNNLLRFYKFTPIGNELAQLIADKPDNTYLPTLKQNFVELFDVH